MKISLLLLTIGVLQVNASLYSQNVRFNLNIKDQPVREVLKEIENKSEFRFFYSDNLLFLDQIVQLKVENSNVEQVLDKLLASSDYSYKVLDNNLVVIAPKNFVSRQAIKVAGKVADAQTGEPLVGVNITVEGTTLGVISDVDGKYSIDVPTESSVLVFSFIGYVSEKVPVSNRSSIDINLVADIKKLDEVVVVGYGTMKKKDLTGSITQIQPDKIANESPKTLQDVLRGTPGLSVSLDPSAKGGGSMQIRGQRSIYTDGGHNDPLVIVDGMMFYGELSEINPNDVSQIDVLKDASAAAVYGAKAANGVIIISTKKGKLGKPKINLTSSVGFVTMGSNREVYGPDGYQQFYEDWFTAPTYGLNSVTGKYEAYQNTKKDQPGYYANPTAENLSKYGITIEQWRSYGNTGVTDKETYGKRLGFRDKTLKNYMDGNTFDWYDHSFRTGKNQDYNLSVSGGNEGMNYYLSMGYLSNEGVAVGNEYSAIRSNMKLEGKVNKWLTIGGNVNFQDRSDGDLAVEWNKQILENSPFSTYSVDGKPVAHPMRDGGYAQGYNYDFDRQYKKLDKGYTVLNSIFTAKVTLPFNITYSFNASPRYQYFSDRYFESALHPDWAGTNGLINREQAKRFDWSLNNTLNWDYTFKQKHHFNVTLVQEAEERRYWQDRVLARNILPTDALGYHETDNADKNKSSFLSEDTHETADGKLARLFYSFSDKYMITASVRRDGYSAFGSSNPRATFGSVSLAWTFTNEKFFNWAPMSMGKLRVSWGQNGNRSLKDPYVALANLIISKNGDVANTQGYVDANGNYVLYQILRVDRLKNPNLQWEKTTAKNIGLDFGFLNNRISGNMDYYVMPTTDMIMNQSLPGFAGFSSITCNLGEVENRGFELSLNTQNIRNTNFEWNTTLNFTKYKNEIKHLYYRYETVLDANGNVISTKEADDVTNKWFIGHPISAIWDYNVTGIWQSDEAAEAAKYGQRPGDPKVANNYTADDKVNTDGSTSPVYNDKDKEFLGQTAAPINWSLRNDFTFFKNLTFSFNIYSFWGQKYMDSNYLNRNNNASEVDNNFNVYAKEYWTLDNPTNEYGRLNAKGPSGLDVPSRVYDRSFVRLESISIGYNVPEKYTSKLGIEKVKVYGSVRNVAVWSKDWKYWDPETYRNTGDGNERSGLAPRIFNIGLNVTL